VANPRVGDFSLMWIASGLATLLESESGKTCAYAWGGPAFLLHLDFRYTDPSNRIQVPLPELRTTPGAATRLPSDWRET
jgi:hypothetical protein